MSETKLNWKQLFLTAVITCIFTIVAGLATYYFTTRSPNLVFSVSEGPVLPILGEYKQIHVLEVRNTGRREVLDVLAQVSILGRIDESSFQGSAGLKPVERKQPTTYEVEVPMLNPGEYFGLAIMVTVPTVSAKPLIAVRGVGVAGVQQDPGVPENKKDEILPTVLVGALAAVSGIFISISPLLRRFLRTPGGGFLQEAFFSSGDLGPFDRNEMVALILARCGLPRLGRMIRFAPSEVSFRGTSDLLFSEAISRPGADRKPYIKALKCMLLIGWMNEASRSVVEYSIRALEGESHNPECLAELRQKKLDERRSGVEFREELEAYLAAVEATN